MQNRYFAESYWHGVQIRWPISCDVNTIDLCPHDVKVTAAGKTPPLVDTACLSRCQDRLGPIALDQASEESHACANTWTKELRADMTVCGKLFWTGSSRGPEVHVAYHLMIVLRIHVCNSSVP